MWPFGESTEVKYLKSRVKSLTEIAGERGTHIENIENKLASVERSYKDMTVSYDNVKNIVDILSKDKHELIRQVQDLDRQLEIRLNEISELRVAIITSTEPKPAKKRITKKKKKNVRA